MRQKYLVDIGMNDEQPDIIRKVNHNFHLLMKTSGQLDLSGTDLDSALAMEVADRSAADVLINERIDNLPAGTMNYNDLENKPSIEGVTLIGNKVFPQFGLHVDSELDPATGGPQSDEKYALTTIEINDLWNLA